MVGSSSQLNDWIQQQAASVCKCYCELRQHSGDDRLSNTAWSRQAVKHSMEHHFTTRRLCLWPPSALGGQPSKSKASVLHIACGYASKLKIWNMGVWMSEWQHSSCLGRASGSMCPLLAPSAC